MYETTFITSLEWSLNTGYTVDALDSWVTLVNDTASLQVCDVMK